MSDDNEQNVYLRIKTVFVGDAIDDRTGESMVVLFLKVLRRETPLRTIALHFLRIRRRPSDNYSCRTIPNPIRNIR